MSHKMSFWSLGSTESSVFPSFIISQCLACGDMALSTMRASKRARQGNGNMGTMNPVMMPGGQAMQGMMPVMHGLFGSGMMPWNHGMNPMAMTGMQAANMNQYQPQPMGCQQGHQQQLSHTPLQLPEDDNGHDCDGESEAEAKLGSMSNNSGQSVVSMPGGGGGGGGGGPPGPPPNEPNEPNDGLSARRTVEMFISRSVTYVKNLPRQRLGEVLERIDQRLDSTFTSECSPAGLLCLLWVYTRIRPQVKLTDLRH